MKRYIYNYKAGDKVLYPRIRNITENHLKIASVGEVTKVKHTNETAYPYTVEFEGVQGDQEPSSQVRELHGVQMILVSGDNTEDCIPANRLVTYTNKFLKDIDYSQGLALPSEEYMDDLKDNYGGYAVIREELQENDKIRRFLDIPAYREILLEPGKTYDGIKAVKTEDLGSGNSDRLRSFIQKYGRKVNFYPDDFSSCSNCSHWDVGENLFYLEPDGFICYYCQESHTYDCDCCDLQFTVAESRPRQLHVHDVEEDMTVCYNCNDRKLWRCRDCGDNFIEATPLFVNSDPLCPNCQNKRCVSYYASPIRGLGRPVLAKLHLDNSKTYARNTSTTPVAIELECIADFELERQSDGDVWCGDYPDGWRDAHDGSLSDDGREFMMNPEIGDDAINRISAMCRHLINNNWIVDSTCGVHVHTDAYHMGVNELKSVLLTVRALEPFIYEMLPNARRESRYSAPMSSTMYTNDIMNVNNIGEFCDLWYQKMNNTSVTTDKYNDSRYRGFNLHSRILHGTLEYRYHHGSLNEEHIINWVLFCLRISDFGSTLLEQPKDIQDLFIHSKSKNFSDYISAMGADSLKPYLRDCVESYGMTPERVFVEDEDWVTYSDAENR